MWHQRRATTAGAVTAEAARRAARSRCCCPSPRPLGTSRRTGPNFEKKVKELCPDCEIIYSNADQDAAKQQQQADAALTKGAKVIVLDPVDAASAGGDRGHGQAEEGAGRQLRPPDHQGGRGLLHLVRQRAGGQAAGRDAVEEAGRGRRQGGPDHDDQRRADRLQRRAVQEGRRGRVQDGGREDRQVLRHAGLEPGQGPAGDGAGHHRPR